MGSPYWMAPEVIEMQPPTSKSDIWSVGCLTVELFTGKPPYFNLTPMSALFHICADKVIPIGNPYNNITPDCLSFINECFQKDPKKRKSATELLQHPWFTNQTTQGEKIVPVSNQGEKSRSSRTLNREVSSPEVASPTLTRQESISIQEIEEVFENIDLDMMADEISRSVSAEAPSETSKSISISSPLPRGTDSSVSAPIQNDQNIHESEIIMNIQIITEATHNDGRITDTVLMGTIQHLYQAVTGSDKSYVNVITNNGLYPLVGVILIHIDNHNLCLLTLKVSLWMFSDS